MRTPFHTFLHRKSLAALLLLALSVVSCKKLIEIPNNPPTEIPSASVFADSLDIMAAMAGIYGNFKVSGGGSNISSGLVTQYTGLSSDELGDNNASDATGLQFYNDALVSTNGSLEPMWQGPYVSLYAVNAALNAIDTAKSAITPALKSQLLGELHVIRAFYYFHLVNLFGGVPLVTETDFNVTASQPRASVDSGYSLIISDLTSARPLLTAAYPSTGRARVNLYTADALLAKVCLYRGQWANAANMVSEVVNSGLYSLVSDPTKVYLDGSTEAIWQLPGKGITQQTTEAFTLVPFSAYSVPNNTLTTFLLNAFEPGDTRRTAWVGTSSVGGKTYYYPYKYKNRTATAATTEDYMMFRLGELYLIRAEALAQQGKTDSALADMNELRTRAGLAAVTTVASQTDLLKAIAHERQTELFCEWGNRWYDLKRTGAADSVMSQEKPGWVSFDALYPIPSTEITDNSFLIQNPGY